MHSGGPGRDCPLTYRYGPSAFQRKADLEVDTLWVAGGLICMILAMAGLKWLMGKP